MERINEDHIAKQIYEVRASELKGRGRWRNLRSDGVDEIFKRREVRS